MLNEFDPNEVAEILKEKKDYKYNDALKKTGKEWSNNFSKELRFYSLFYCCDSRGSPELLSVNF